MKQSKTLPFAAHSGPPVGLAAAPSTFATAEAASSAGVFESLFHRVLTPMRRGHLVVQLPDGRRRDYGQDRDVPVRLPGEIPGTAHIRVLDARFFRECVLGGDIGFSEAYLEGYWETPDLRAVIAWFLLNLDTAPTLSGSARKHAQGLLAGVRRLSDRLGHLLRPNSRNMVRRNISDHYDLSNRFFSLLLDPSMMYSCGRWTRAGMSLAEAQAEKNEALCRMLRLRREDQVLEIGTGWGGWALHAAAHYGCHITTLTISREQHTLAVGRIKAAGLESLIDVRLLDFRDLSGRFDKVVSIEMMEALGHRYLPDFCRTIHRVLRPEGLVALQFITCPDARYEEFRGGVDFIQKHIFPGSLLLSLNRVNDLLSRTGNFVTHQVTDLGHDYVRTLHAWRDNFHEHLDEVRRLGMDDRFIRKWNYYLDYCGAAFAMRNISVVQTLHTRANNISFGPLAGQTRGLQS